MCMTMLLAYIFVFWLVTACLYLSFFGAIDTACLLLSFLWVIDTACLFFMIPLGY